MTRFARGIRAGAFALSVVLLVLVPGIALATFTGGTSAPLTVTTATMVAPSAVTGTYTCTRSGLNEGINVSVTGFTDAGPSGAQYLYTLRIGTSVKDTNTSATRSSALTSSQLRDVSTNVYTVDIQAKLGSWTSPVTSRTATCTDGSRATSNL